MFWVHSFSSISAEKSSAHGVAHSRIFVISEKTECKCLVMPAHEIMVLLLTVLVATEDDN